MRRSLLSRLSGVVIVAALWLGVVVVVLSGVSGCASSSVSRSSRSGITADYFRVVDLAKCPKVARWFVRPAYRYHGVAIPADSTPADSAVQLAPRCDR